MRPKRGFPPHPLPEKAAGERTGKTMCKERYVCKIPTIEEIRRKWDYEIEHNVNKENWIVWKQEAIDHYLSGQSIAYYGFLDENTICEATAVLCPVFPPEYKMKERTVELCAFRTIKEYRGKGYFSELMDYIQHDLKKRGYRQAIVGVEPKETLNKSIYRHWGFTEYMYTGTETYPDGTIIEVEFFGKRL